MLQQIILTSLILIFPSLAGGDINYTPQPQTVEQKIEIAFGKDAEIMKKISICESGMRQFDIEGNTITSPTNDSGLFQINHVWEKKAQELGLDYKNSTDDNIAMAKYILDNGGLNHWVCYKKVI